MGAPWRWAETSRKHIWNKMQNGNRNFISKILLGVFTCCLWSLSSCLTSGSMYRPPLAKVENLPNPNENYGSFSKSAVRCFSVLFCFRYSTIKNPHIYIFCKCKKCCRRQDIEQETLSKCRPTKRSWSNW